MADESMERWSKYHGLAIAKMAAAMQEFVKRPLGNIESLESVLVGWLGDAWPYIARAAIEAMREPTATQLAAAQTAWLNDPLRKSSTIYRAMIDAALNSPSTTFPNKDQA
jgi:hypothetical protein